MDGKPGRILFAIVFAAVVQLFWVCLAAAAEADPGLISKILAPSGTLRAAINLGNPILATRDPASGKPQGVSVDIAQKLARQLAVKLELVVYESAGKVVEGVKAGAWDIAFVAIDPARAADMNYTAPYIVIEGAYLVPEKSPIRRNADVDQAGTRIVVGAGSAYDLFLSREIKHATLVKAPSSPKVTEMMVQQSLDVAAGVKQQLQADAGRISGLRLLEGNFMLINQAMAAPKGHEAGMPFLSAFVEQIKSSGLVARLLAAHHIEGAAIAPLAAR